MHTAPLDHRSPQVNKTELLNQKILAVAQELLIEEMMADTILAVGDGFTSKILGRYGRYETFNGELISFQPQFNLNYTLISPEFVVTSSLTMIKTICYNLEDYELSIGL